MRFRTFVILTVVALMAASLSAAPARAWQKKTAQKKADPISGDWNTSLTAASGNGFTLTLKLKLDRGKVTGTYESDHVGSGNIKNGSWAANKLNLSLETNHGLIALTGEMKQGKLAGKFDAGQMQGTWQANKK